MQSELGRPWPWLSFWVVGPSMRSVWDKILPLPIIGDLLYYANYAFVLVWGAVAATICGWQRLKFGTSVFWIPKQNAQMIRKGVELLRIRDPEMFSRLTSERRLIIYYFEGSEFFRKSSHRLFFMHARFVEIGPEGVACFIVQSLMMAAAVRRVNQRRLDDQEKAALKPVSRNMVEWLREHSFNPELISAYQKAVDRQEQRGGAALERL